MFDCITRLTLAVWAVFSELFIGWETADWTGVAIGVLFATVKRDSWENWFTLEWDSFNEAEDWAPIDVCLGRAKKNIYNKFQEM